jgi:hypothetical protein
LIARGVAEAVVDDLEVVEVQVQHGQTGGLGAGARHRLPEALDGGGRDWPARSTDRAARACSGAASRPPGDQWPLGMLDEIGDHARRDARQRARPRQVPGRPAVRHVATGDRA